MSSPKATLHMLYVHSEQQPRYETVSVLAEKESPNNSSTAFLVKPLSLQLGGFRCTLFVPNCLPVVSEVFPKKKEAEQDAAKKALEQMGKSFTLDDSASKISTPEEKMTALADRIGAIFSEKVIMSCQPMKEHFKAAMKRQDGRIGAVSAAVLAVLDNRISSLCRSLHASSDCDPLFAVAMVREAAKRCPLVCCEDGYLIKRKVALSPQFQEEFLASESQREAYSKFEAVYIPSSEDLMVRSIEIEIEPQDYYMDILARKLGTREGSGIMMSRTVPKAPHDTRLYCAIPDMRIHPDAFEEALVGVKLSGEDGLQWNRRASDLLGYSIYGDAILASVGSTWKSEGKLAFADLSVSFYFRLLLGRTPEGSYKLSRDAILVSKLPCSFSSRAQWRGALPRSLLMDFCHQQRLADPEFSFFSTKDSDNTRSIETEKGSSNSYKCGTRIVYEGQAMDFESEHHYRNRNDAVQSAALQALLHLTSQVSIFPKNSCLIDLVEPTYVDDKRGLSTSVPSNGTNRSEHQGFTCSNRTQDDSNRIIAAGSMACISCNIWLLGCGLNVKVEEHEEFDFELGIGGIIPELENMVLGMQAGECAQLILPVPCHESVLATHEAVHGVEKSSIGMCSLRYCTKLLRVLEPPEDRMESALFSPPLSKQRNEFAVREIKKLRAKSLVDFGCGSGSLLDAVVDDLADLECIAGVDISLKSLLRAAKSLNSKLLLKDHNCNKLKEVVLYEGSLAEPDPCLCGFDVATCIEVVEHMDPEPLLKAGDIILGKYAPQTLILSTPNIEYNVLLQKIVDTKTVGESKRVKTTSTCLDSGAPLDDPTNKSQSVTLSDDESSAQPIKLRNDDHRFEWTRVEFQEWADNLALRFGYTVEFTGVGGSVEDPGFASQIALFTRKSLDFPSLGKVLYEDGNLSCYREVWKYDREGIRR
ncbi:hypothetical protein GOP47_0003889 [Adiantum capillus-veneris]|uniref:Small RNA 2'-O-methyltransferase n=1 Tax=Adiantum capillus-veneris TaxID=13818 RepID=A0A9D4V7J8_ADICA|nr:hypothetical protein GOP47_0003889 [Adiantum capillus-veneris]